MPPKSSKDFPWRIFIYQTVWNSNRFVASCKYKVHKPLTMPKPSLGNTMGNRCVLPNQEGAFQEKHKDKKILQTDIILETLAKITCRTTKTCSFMNKHNIPKSSDKYFSGKSSLDKAFLQLKACKPFIPHNFLVNTLCIVTFT